MMHCIHTFVAQNSFYKKRIYNIYLYLYIYIIYRCFFMHLNVFVMGKISFLKKNTAKQIPGKVQHKVMTQQIIAR